MVLLTLRDPSTPPLPAGAIGLDDSPALLSQHALGKVRTQEAEHTCAWLSRPVGFGTPTGLPLLDHRHLGDL